jgi:hypothetical protein
MTTRVLLGFALTATFALPAEAQMPQWQDRGYFTFSLGIQPQSREFDEVSTPVIYRENASISVPHTISSGIFADLSAGYRVWENLAIGLGFSHFSDTDTPTLTAQIPNPFYFASPRRGWIHPVFLSLTRLRASRCREHHRGRRGLPTRGRRADPVLDATCTF